MLFIERSQSSSTSSSCSLFLCTKRVQGEFSYILCLSTHYRIKVAIMIENPVISDVNVGSNVPTMEQRYPKISVVVPARNEASNLVHVLPHIPSSVDEVI